MSKSGTIQAIVAAIFAIGIVIWLHFSVFDKSNVHANADPSERLENASGGSSDLLQETIKLINSTCPKDIDSETRLDSASYLPGNVFAEYFTLINMEQKSVDTATIKPAVQVSILNSIKGNSGYASFRSSNVTFTYIYKDKEQKPLFTIAITPEQYNN
ncbi:MAG TPA: hypothetical protein VK809_05970 [Bacteroidia bacterium]|jgi:hypothetical protein|nr:hypothetical protein [Bacteroidia bacterium]